MTLTDVATLALPIAIFACGGALLSHRFYVAYRGWSLREFSYKTHLPGILGTALMLFAILLGASLGWAHVAVAVLGGSALCYLYVYVLRMSAEAALLGPVLAVLSIFLMPTWT
ncbi:MAG TPA: hypothetical protein VFK86_01400 [Bauldia sp.]|jgi:uncharacterized membrane-anchored protein|nr:hypothetical protein [Bauldia sp.]